MKILIDNGHGKNTPGKCSPDGVFKEWAFVRDVADIVIETLTKYGFEVVRLVPEEDDIPLGERCKRANKYRDSILISIHSNAAGNGKQWSNARGWQVHTYTNPSTESTKLADCLFDKAVENEFKTRKPAPNQKYWKSNFKILRETTMPSVLIENFFYDNKEDLEYLCSSDAVYDCAKVIVDGVVEYLHPNGSN